MKKDHGLIVGKILSANFEDMTGSLYQRCFLEKIAKPTKEARSELESLGVVTKITDDEIFIDA